MSEANPLLDKSKWEPKTWVVPLMITVMVDDASKYDMHMDKLVKNVVNELRRITANFDKSRGQLSIEAGMPVKDPSVWETLSQPGAAVPTSKLEDMVRDMLTKMKKEEKES